MPPETATDQHPAGEDQTGQETAYEQPTPEGEGSGATYDDIMASMDPTVGGSSEDDANSGAGDHDDPEGQASGKRETGEGSTSDDDTGDDGSLVEIDFGGEIGKKKVSPEIAEAVRQQQRDYKHLQSEFTRRSQRLKELESGEGDDRGKDRKGDKQPDRQPDPQASKKWLAEQSKALTKAIDSEQDEQVGEIISKIAGAHATAATRRMESQFQEALESFQKEHFQPFKDLVENTLGDQIFETQIEGALGQIEEQYGITGIDPKKVGAEAKKLIKAGEPRDLQTMFLAAMRTLAGNKAQAPPAASRSNGKDTEAKPSGKSADQRPPAPHRRGPAGGSPDDQPAKEPRSRVVHRTSPLDSL